MLTNIFLITFIILFFILGIVGVSSLVTASTGYTENFYNDSCTDCNHSGWRRKDLCASCKNCGWSVGYDGFGQCIPGYLHGPVTNLNTQKWYYRGKLIWKVPNPRLTASIPRETTPHLSHIPRWNTAYQNRMRNDYGNYRHGKRFGYGLDQRYHTERY